MPSASGILGYFYGLAHFSAEEIRHGHAGRGPGLSHGCTGCSCSGASASITRPRCSRGWCSRAAYHAAFNLAASQGRVSVMLVPGRRPARAFLYYLLGLKSNREKIGAISAPKRVARDLSFGRLRRRSV